jgi:8-oxo-dGTP pyrophosphatase MutT (NUDIX family)
MQWKVHAERVVYSDPPWIEVSMAEVELPDGRRIPHNVVRVPLVVATVVINDQDQVLMLWRHRFITDRWNWEIPAGFVDVGETAEKAAAREVEEETGYRPGPLSEIARIEPIAGITNAVHIVFLAHSAQETGKHDANEADEIAWIPLADITKLIDKGDIVAGVTMVGLLRLLVDRHTRQTKNLTPAAIVADTTLLSNATSAAD